MKVKLTRRSAFRANVGDFWRVRRGKFVSNMDAPVVLSPKVTFGTFFRVTTRPVNRFTDRGKECFGCAVKELVVGFAPV